MTTNSTTAALFLVTLLAVFALGLLALLVFWQLAKHRRPGAAASPARGWQVLVGIATITSAAVAVANYLGS